MTAMEGVNKSASNAPVPVAVDPVSNALLVEVASSGVGSSTAINDGVVPSQKATVSQFHNADNQAPGGTAYGLLTGGVAQLLNSSGNLDRQRETSGDIITSLGIATGTQQLAWPATAGPVTTGAITGSGTAQTITLTNVSGTVRNIPWAIQVGQTLVLEPNTATQEAFTVTAVNVGAKTVTGVIQKNHASSAAVTAFFYDQARSGMIADGAPGQGMAAGATYLLNTQLNSANGGWEGERSAAGELDGASGTGTAVAAEYEHTSGGPVLASGLASGLQFDRARNINGTGLGTGSITSSVAGNTSIVLGSAAATNLIQPGAPISLSGSGTTEVVFATAAWVPGSSATVPLQSPVVNTGQTTATWSQYAPNGPGLNGFLPFGIGIEEEALYNPVDGKFYIERAATQDAMPTPNIVAENPALFNGATMDRQRGNVDTGALVTLSAASAGGNSTDQTNYNGRGLKLVINITALTGTTPTLTVTIQGKDTASGVYYTILASTALNATGTTVLEVYPGILNAANSAQGVTLPRTYRILYAIGGSTPAVTATIGASVIV